MDILVGLIPYASATQSSIYSWLLVGACTVGVIFALTRSHKLIAPLSGPPSRSWVAGHFKDMLSPDGLQIQKEYITTYGPTMKLNGGFGEEFIYTIDPAIMHAAFVKDRTKFERGEGLSLLLRSIFGGGLLGMRGEEHRVHRKLVTPVFTMKFLRELMPIFTDIAKQTCHGIHKSLNVSNGVSKTIDVYPWATAAAIELIGEAGLGSTFDSFTGKQNEYLEVVKIITQAVSDLSAFTNLLPYLYRVGTSSLRRWTMLHFPWSTIQRLRNAVRIQNHQAEEAIQGRQALINAGAELTSRAGRGRDLVTLLMKANEAAGSDDYIDHEALIGHMNTFVFAGHETTSTAVVRVLDELSSRQHIQDKLREELSKYFEVSKEDTHHDGLLELPYLDAVIRETLRLQGPVPVLFRECIEDTIVTLTYPIDTPSGKILRLPVGKGTRVIIGVSTSNRYDKIWGERADEFVPERWIGKTLEEVTQLEHGSYLPGVYSSMMTFGAGSYSCIGFEFAIMELKVLIAQLIYSFKFEPSEEEICWQLSLVTLPYLKQEQHLPRKFPKLPLKVTEL